MSSELQQTGYKFWLQWVLACTIGWTVAGQAAWSGLSLQFLLGLVKDGSSDLAHVLGMVLFGSLLGTAQWLILRRQLSRAGWWVLAVAAGEVIGEVLGSRVGFIVDRCLGMGVGAELSRVAVMAWCATEAVLVATGQWLVLRQRINQAGWWVLVATAGWVVSYATGELVDEVVGEVARWAVVGSIYGIITGTVLVWLLCKVIPESD
jgi:hypothetical protein